MAFAPRLYAIPGRAEVIPTRPAPHVLAQLERRKTDEMKLKRDVDRACRILERLEQRLEQLKATEKDLDRRKKRALAKYEWFENAVIAALQSRSLERVDGIERVLRLQAAPPSLEVFDQSRIPAAYMRQPKPQPSQPDKVFIKKILERANADDASKADIAAAAEIGGCRLTQGVTLTRA